MENQHQIASIKDYIIVAWDKMDIVGHRWTEGRVCGGHPVRTEAIDELVWQSIKDLLLRPETIISEYQRRLHTTTTDYEALITQKNNEISGYKKERVRLIDLFQSGLVEKMK